MKIAGHKTVEEWKNLEKKLKPAYNENWEEAYAFFELRICTRYLKPIDAILNLNTNNGEGFAVVNLQCSLIETIESFINGCISHYSYKKKKVQWKREDKIIFHTNKEIFSSFFNFRAPFRDLKIDGELFYKDVRCSLLHETQTKNNWKIKISTQAEESFKAEGKFKIIYRENFQSDLKILINEYKRSIISGVEFDGISAYKLRENFISKFNHICKES